MQFKLKFGRHILFDVQAKYVMETVLSSRDSHIDIELTRTRMYVVDGHCTDLDVPSFYPFSSHGGTLSFNTLNINSHASWFTDKPEGKDLPVLCVQQLEKDTIFIGLERILT